MVKRPGREVDHIRLVPRLRMCGAIPPLLPHVFMSWYLVKHRDSFNILASIYGYVYKRICISSLCLSNFILRGVRVKPHAFHNTAQDGDK
jgi:hypothetical protein